MSDSKFLTGFEPKVNDNGDELLYCMYRSKKVKPVSLILFFGGGRKI